jgi:signal transduction histidine kinase
MDGDEQHGKDMKRVFCCALALLLSLDGPAHAQDRDKLSRYLYEDTKQLVVLVEDAAALIEQKGKTVFSQFQVKNSRWLTDQRYLFIYDLNGKCVFHPIEPGLVGQNLIRLKDLDGRPMVAMITDVGKKPEADASGWVFYLWEESPNSRIPAWKSSYVRKAVAPGGTTYLVGSGLYNMKTEKCFLEGHVNRAADLIADKGKEAAFEELRNRACPLHILDTYITVTDHHGDIVVDPSFPTLLKKRNLLSFYDKTGRNIYAQITEGIKEKDRMWLMYIWPKGDAHRLARHMMYVRKVMADGEVFYVSANFVPATPVWMKQ